MTGIRPRDTQRQRVYDAEQDVREIFDLAEKVPGRMVEVFGSRINLPAERRMVSLESISVYLNSVLALGWVQDRYPRARIPVTVRARRGAAHAHYEPATSMVAVPLHHRAALRELLLLHELAHHLQPPASAGHGPQFCGVFVELLDGVMGPEAGWLMRAALADNGARLSDIGSRPGRSRP
ncbi:TIGR04338 family metallohydrolase [Nocardia abscessus]|uniref:TIGR04338 family metallohydrolase n=1 Tax=Nocardia abscessus TaxID=120957 RepID=UPI0018962D76|nr:TIGR04338 family metallohydrolase [Nocardia abscessus]MBF6339813.1 TIGR04338 family metallohydrolase [Nocardia abscessus]